MQKAKSFGRRPQPSRAPSAIARTADAEPTVAQAEPLPTSAPSEQPPSSLLESPPRSVEQELAEWKESRKIRKRSFREPWRSVSIVAGIAFAATSWILPGEVATVASIGLGVLTAGSLYAGWRGRR